MATVDVQVAHMWRRLGFGATRSEIDAGVAMGPQAVIADLLSRPPTLSTAADPIPWGWPAGTDYVAVNVAMSRQMELMAYGTNTSGTAITVATYNPLQERMSWILQGLLVIGISDYVYYPDMLGHINLLRNSTTGSYKQLLQAVSTKAGMLKYLSLFTSTGAHPNENYARELMELFALGRVNPYDGAANYTQNDVHEMARALTGWTYNYTTAAVSFNQSLWDPVRSSHSRQGEVAGGAHDEQQPPSRLDARRQGPLIRHDASQSTSVSTTQRRRMVQRRSMAQRHEFAALGWHGQPARVDWLQLGRCESQPNQPHDHPGLFECHCRNCGWICPSSRRARQCIPDDDRQAHRLRRLSKMVAMAGSRTPQSPSRLPRMDVLLMASDSLPRKELNRRAFLQRVGLTLAAGAVGNQLLDWSLPEMAAAAGVSLPFGKPIVVSIELAGGNDNLNMHVPHNVPGVTGYYRAARPYMGLGKVVTTARPYTAPPAGNYAPPVLDLDGAYGLHGNLPWLANRWWTNHDVAIVQGTGENVMKEMSHFAAMAYRWSAAFGGPLMATGWLGRYNDLANPAQALGAISLAGLNQSLASLNSPAVAINDIASFDWPGSYVPNRPAWLADFVAMGDPNLPASLNKAAVAGKALFSANSAIAQVKGLVPPAGSGNASLAGQLQTAATLIGAGVPCQTYVASLGGWDLHNGAQYNQWAQLGQLDDALKKFFTIVDGSPRANDVFVVITSEFGRQVTENSGAGTDHGRASSPS